MDKKVVVITGVSRGLGNACAKEFIQRGWHVAGCGNTRSILEQLQQEYGKNHLFSVVDIRNEQAVATWSQEVVQKVGIPDLVINNAGLINRLDVLWRIPSSEWDAVLATNVTGTFHVIKAFVPLMTQGLIVNISSEGGRQGAAQFGPYCASKFAVEGLTKSLAQELPKGLFTVALDPGGVRTDMLEKTYGEEAKNYPTAAEKAKKMVPYILKITDKENGKSLTSP